MIRRIVIGVLIALVLTAALSAHAWIDETAKYRERFAKAEKHRQQNQLPAAAAIYAELSNTDWPLADLAAARARDIAQQNHDVDGVRNWNQFIIDKFPLSHFRPAAMLDAADCDIAHTQAARALTLCDQYLSQYQTRPLARVWLLRGRALEATNKPDEAVTAYGQAAFYFVGQYADAAATRLGQLRAAGRTIAYPPPEEMWGKVVAFYRAGSYAVAQALAERFASYYPDSPDAFRAKLIAVDALIARKKKKEAKARLDALSRSARNDDERIATLVRSAKLTKTFSTEKKRSLYLMAAQTAAGSGAHADGLVALFHLEWSENRFADAAKWGDQALAENVHFLLDPADLRWRNGLAHFLAHDFAGAQREFRQFLASFPDHDRTQGALYWLARSLEMTGKTAEAQQTYSQCVAQKSWNYYGLISEARLREQGVAVDGTLLRPRETPTPTPPVLNAEWAQTDAGGPQLDVGAKKSIDYYATQGPAAVRPVFQSLRELRDLNLTDEISDRLDFVKDQVQATADGSYFLSVGYALAGDNWSSIIAAVRGLPHVQQGRLRDPQGLLVRRVYPTLYSDMVRQAGRRYDLDYLFLLAIIKQESAFNVNDRSWAGAIGLIQVMPGTARYIARKRGLRRFQPATLYRPEVSLDYGCYELADLMKKTNGDLAAVLAGYNAGYGRPRQWWPLHTERSYDEMIELIPITETRDYVKIIFANYEMYQRLYRDDPTHAANRPSELKKLFGRVRPLGS